MIVPTARPDLSELAAAEFVERHGEGALSILEDRAALANQLGHAVAARTWRSMAAAAARALRQKKCRRDGVGFAAGPGRIGFLSSRPARTGAFAG
jgi:hypothetical protein